METAGLIFSILTAVGTLAMAGVGYYALYTWKKEFIGKRKIELAAEIMETACEIQDLIIGARLMVYARIELQEATDWINSEKLRDPQNTEVFPDRIAILIPHRRLAAGQDKIEKLRGFSNKVFLYWGMDMMKLIYDLTEYTLQIRTAAKDLYYGDFPEKHKEFLKIIYYDDANDEINKKVNDIIEEFKLNLEPLYKDKQTKWKKLDNIKTNDV